MARHWSRQPGPTPYAWRAAVITAVVTATSAVLLVVVVREVLGLDFEAITESPLGVQRRSGPRYSGFLGSLAVLGWAVATTASALAASLLRGREPARTRLLATSAGVSLMLLVDEGFAVHHSLAPAVLGIPKALVILGIVLVATGWLIAFRRPLSHDPDAPILVWALLWLGLSLAIDAAGDLIGWGGVREETAKLIGASSWVVFHWRLAHRSLRPLTTSPTP